MSLVNGKCFYKTRKVVSYVLNQELGRLVAKVECSVLERKTGKKC